jgi:hypothetical protein
MSPAASPQGGAYDLAPAIAQQLPASPLALMARTVRGHAGVVRDCGRLAADRNHSERSGVDGRGRAGFGLTDRATLRFRIAADAIGIDLFAWDADWLAARLILADPDQACGRMG